MVMSSEMIAITTSSSTSVKPAAAKKPRLGASFLISPLLVGDAVQPLVGAEGVDVVHVVSGLGVVGGALVTAQAPGLLGAGIRLQGKWIARQAAQEVDLGLPFWIARVGDAIHQHLERRRIAARIDGARDAVVVE